MTELNISDRPSAQQLSVVSTIGTLRRLTVQGGFWLDLSTLAALCHPANRLHQLEEFNARKTSVEAEDMQQLVRLPAPTKILPDRLQPDAYPYLPRFARLQHVVIMHAQGLRQPGSQRGSARGGGLRAAPVPDPESDPESTGSWHAQLAWRNATECFTNMLKECRRNAGRS